MARFSGEVKVGDVICVRSSGWAGKLIRFGAAILGRSNLVNHIVIAHHVDDGGTLWGIEGRPGGVGWVDVSEVVKGPFTNANTEQPKTDEQRTAIAKFAESLLGTPYDWSAIVADAMDSLRLAKLWHKETSSATVPAHVVCSSFADWIYEQVGLASPNKVDGDYRYTTPADWDEFIMEAKW